jgi:tetratricopeptide (TPR) repeat protein
MFDRSGSDRPRRRLRPRRALHRVLNGRVAVSFVGTAMVTGMGLTAGLENISASVRVGCTLFAALVAGGLAALPDGSDRADRKHHDLKPAPQSVSRRAVSRTGPSRPVPQQLPPAIRHFTGREAILAEMTRLLAERADPGAGAPVVAVHGKAGVGKTALAVRLAHEIAPGYPDGQLYMNLRGPDWEPLEVGVVLAGFLAELGVASTAIPTELEDRARMYQARLAGRRILVLLDNAASEAQLRPLLPTSATCTVVITSRRRLTGLIDAHPVALDVISEDKGIELLGKIAGESRVTSEPDAAREIVRLCGGLPLAVRIIGAKLDSKRHWRLARMAEQLRDEQGRLAALEIGDQGFQASVTLSYEELSETEQRAFRLLGLVRSAGFADWVLAPLLEVSVAESEDIMERLVDAQLMETPAEEHSPVPYRFHDLIRVYARERLAADETDESRREAVRRLLGAYLTLAESAVHEGNPYALAEGLDEEDASRWGADDPAFTAISTEDPLRWMLGECRPLARGVGQANEYEMWRLSWRIGTLLFAYFDSLRGYWTRWQETFDQALAAARRDGSRFGQAVLLHARGALFRDEDRFDEASGQFAKALALFQELGVRRGEAAALRSIGEAHRAQGRFSEAEEQLLEALAISHELRDQAGEARALRELGGIHRSLRRGQDALTELEAALRMFERVGDRTEQARTLRSIGGVLRDLHRYDEASDALETARAILADLGNQIWEVRTAYSLGRVRLEQGRLAEAEALLTEALTAFTDSGYRLWMARASRALARVRLVQGRCEEALRYADEALAGFVELDMELWRAHTLRTKGEVLIALNRNAEAVALLTEAVEMFREYEDRWSRADALRLLGAAKRGLKRYDGSKACHYEALEVFRDFGDRWSEAAVLDQLAATRRATGQRLRARTLRQEARAIRAALQAQNEQRSA